MHRWIALILAMGMGACASMGMPDPFADLRPTPDAGPVAPSPAPGGPALVSAVTGASAQQIRGVLDSGDAAAIATALDAIEANPGAYLPMSLAAASRERFLRSTEQASALELNRFAYFRLLADLNLLRQSDPRADNLAVQLVGRFAEAQGEGLSLALAALPAEERARLAGLAITRDAAAPRRYPPDWALRLETAQNENYVLAPALWPSDVSARYAALLPAFTEEFRRAEMERAPAPSQFSTTPDSGAPPQGAPLN